MAYAGNPLRSTSIQRLKQGYAQAAKKLGVRALAAKPWTVADVTALMMHLQSRLLVTGGMTHLLLLRDALILALLWNTQSRGANAGAWRLSNLKLPSGKCPALNCSELVQEVRTELTHACTLYRLN